MVRLICMTIVLTVGVASITTMGLYALSQGVNGILLSFNLVVVAGLVSGFCGFRLKEVLDWWRGE